MTLELYIHTRKIITILEIWKWIWSLIVTGLSHKNSIHSLSLPDDNVTDDRPGQSLLIMTCLTENSELRTFQVTLFYLYLKKN